LPELGWLYDLTIPPAARGLASARAQDECLGQESKTLPHGSFLNDK